MSSLITIKDSIHDRVWLYEAIGFASKGDAVLLIESAVSALHSNITLASFAAKCKRFDVSLYALQEDLTERGLALNLSGVTLITRREWLNLIDQFNKQVAW